MGLFGSNKHHIGPQTTARPSTRTAQARNEITNGLCFGCATMKPVRTSDVASAVPVDGRGRRSPGDVVARSVRDYFFSVAARRFCVGMSDRQAARYLRSALLRYRGGRWRRTRSETK